MKSFKIVLLLIILTVILTGCNNLDMGEEAESAFAMSHETPEVSTEPSPTPQPEEPPVSEPDEEPIKDVAQQVAVTFGGDVLIDSGIKNLYNSEGFSGIFSEDDIKGLSDIFMVNLEFPFSTRGEAMPEKEWTFRGDPKHIRLLTELGVDIVTLANNHTLDYGEDAFLDTMELLNANDIHYVGGGADMEEASSYETLEINGIKIAFLAASRVIPHVDWHARKTRPGLFSTYDPNPLIEKITDASASADFVVVYVHWGVEKSFIPEEWQRNMAKQYIDAGASCVIGSHPHVLQGIEYYMGKPIIYSLGNFVFPSGNTDTMTTTVTFGESISVTLKPYMIKKLKTIPAEEPEDRERILKHLRDISFNATIDDDFSVHSLEQEETNTNLE